MDDIPAEARQDIERNADNWTAGKSRVNPVSFVAFNDEASDRANGDVRASDSIAAFTDADGNLKAKWDKEMIDTLLEKNDADLETTYGTNRDQVIKGLAYLTVRETMEVG